MGYQSWSGEDCSAPGRWERLADSKVCDRASSSCPHSVCNQSQALERVGWVARPSSLPEGWVTSELPGKQSTAKLRAFPEAAEVACVRNQCQRRTAGIYSGTVLAGLLQGKPFLGTIQLLEEHSIPEGWWNQGLNFPWCSWSKQKEKHIGVDLGPAICPPPKKTSRLPS